MVFHLSCTDRRWDENFSSLLEGRGLKIEYNVSCDGISTTTVLPPGCKEPLTLEEYLKSEVNESIHELIRTNVLNATRNFQHRVDAFIREVIFELQGRVPRKGCWTHSWSTLVKFVLVRETQ